MGYIQKQLEEVSDSKLIKIEKNPSVSYQSGSEIVIMVGLPKNKTKKQMESRSNAEQRKERIEKGNTKQSKELLNPKRGLRSGEKI